MTAEIAETTVYDVRCGDPGCLQYIAEGLQSRADAEFIADSHDATWHTPELEDVVPA